MSVLVKLLLVDSKESEKSLEKFDWWNAEYAEIKYFQDFVLKFDQSLFLGSFDSFFLH